MRCKQIEVKFRIPVRINESDGNGNIYTEEAIKNACAGASGQPIIQYDEKGMSVPVGVANKVEYSDGFISVEGFAFYGGTEETVKFDSLQRINEMNICGFSIGN